jgi:hypothetical protein
LTSKHNAKFENEDIDFWNDVLPEELVSHIISFLPTKDAIKTSVLSKTCRNLWTTNISNLDFSDFKTVNCHSEHWVEYAKRVIPRLQSTTSIDKISIPLKSFTDVSLILEWISFAVVRHVKDLTLSRGSNEYLRMNVPPSLFYCKSLEKLELCNRLRLKIPQKRSGWFPNLKFLSLESVSISGIPDEENSPCFPKLKNLCLNMIKYEGKDDCVMKLIRNCPLLDDLSIRRFLADNVSNDDMCIPQLTSADLKFPYYTNGFNVEIEAPIKHLGISNWNPTCRIIVKNLESLINARLSFSYTRDVHYSEQQELLKLFKMVDKVKSLSLGYQVNNVIEITNIRLPLFSNLIELEVFLGCKEFCILERLLKSTNNLQTLVIHNFRVHVCVYIYMYIYY